MTDPVAGAKQALAEYYAAAAADYDALHIDPRDEHAKALGWLAAMIGQYAFTSVLDVGSGTGRALFYLKDRPGLELKGVEPSQALREIAYAKGLAETQLVAGDALALEFVDNSIDVVCAFGILHHIEDHRRAVAEMCRVARRAVFISDANNFGQGSFKSRAMKQILNALGLWRICDYIRTGFRGYHFSEGDGVYYSYSIHDDVLSLRSKFPDVYYMSTRPSGPDLYRAAQTLAVFATREDKHG
ncbi:hypothetical protein A1351_17795 [Methylosinus sp. R-45379]|uniref:class I SAM-dependent methyltransferase n=1 Tax=unclassified Methylosinus TaxID=2624500 RepID=UPI000465DF0D|nr:MULTISPECIES: class I SAM-dependent methyltransferase [unclassified Methylosinus]OAI24510.1 hypothetical protein A1351_17795 [Methylosinus sp. R-45379]